MRKYWNKFIDSQKELKEFEKERNVHNVSSWINDMIGSIYPLILTISSGRLGSIDYL